MNREPDMSFRSRPLAHLADDLEGVHERCARLSDTAMGLSFLFGVLAAMTVAGGVWAREPLFFMSAGFALAASAAFGLTAHSMARAAAHTPRIRTAPVTISAKAFRRAA